MESDLAQPPTAVAPTPQNIAANAPLPRVGYNTGAAAYIDNTPDQAIFAQLCLAPMNECELQIISTTNEV
jgi:hypothetical protein